MRGIREHKAQFQPFRSLDGPKRGIESEIRFSRRATCDTGGDREQAG